jgi:hypothetical protein
MSFFDAERTDPRTPHERIDDVVSIECIDGVSTGDALFYVSGRKADEAEMKQEALR